MSKRIEIVLATVVVVIAAGVGGIWWYLRDDSPAAVNLADAIESVQTSDAVGAVTTVAATSETTAATETTAAAVETTAAATSGVAGSWAIDTTTGEFDYESATGSFVGFRIAEELASIGSTTAVGRTGDITGTMEIDGTTVTAASFDIDATTFTTNDSRRDDKVQSALDTDEFPAATFALTAPIELGEAAATGGQVSVTATGDLTIHGVTKSVTFDLDAQLVDSTVVVVGTTPVVFSDYGIELPTSPIVLSLDDNGTLEFQFLLVKS